MEQRKLLSVVVPVLNEADVLEQFHARLSTAVAHLDCNAEFLFVDDGSTDASVNRLRSLRATDPRVQILRLSRNFGSHAACLAGLTHCRGDYAVILTADLQDPPEVIEHLIEAAERGNEVVLAERVQRDDPFSVRLFSGLYNWLMRRIAIGAWPERGFDFLLMSRPVVDLLVRARELNSSLFGQVLWAGFRQAKVPYHRHERRSGRSRWTLARKVKLAIDSIVAFSYVPIRLISGLGVGCACLGLLYALFVVAMRVFFQATITGWASLMVVVLLIGGVQMTMLGVIGEYVWRTLDEARGRAPFIVAERVGSEGTTLNQ